MKRLSSEKMLADQVRSALPQLSPGFIEKSFIIYRLPRAVAVFMPHRCGRAVLRDSKCVCIVFIHMQLLTVAETDRMAGEALMNILSHGTVFSDLSS